MSVIVFLDLVVSLVVFKMMDFVMVFVVVLILKISCGELVKIIYVIIGKNDVYNL